jgi:hypothetical protein
MQLSKERQNYENTKRLAEVWAKSEGKIAVIYSVSEGVYAFMDYDCPEAETITPIEFISGL